MDKRLKKPLAAASQRDIVRFMAKVRYEDPPPGVEGRCWMWEGATSQGGQNPKRPTSSSGYNWYGSFKYAGTGVRAHRFSCEAIAQRPALPPGHHRDHLCNKTLCVNPAHIEYVTHEENEARRVTRTAAPPEASIDPFEQWEADQ